MSADSSTETAISETDDADSDARTDDSEITFDTVAELWPTMPATVRADLLAVLQAWLASSAT